MFEVPIDRPGERDVLCFVLPLMFCDGHHLSAAAKARLAASARLRRALEKRIDGGWSVHLERAWIQRTRIEGARAPQ